LKTEAGPNKVLFLCQQQVQWTNFVGKQSSINFVSKTKDAQHKPRNDNPRWEDCEAWIKRSIGMMAPKSAKQGGGFYASSKSNGLFLLVSNPQ
jgi:hypothetical protein